MGGVAVELAAATADRRLLGPEVLVECAGGDEADQHLDLPWTLRQRG